HGHVLRARDLVAEQPCHDVVDAARCARHGELDSARGLRPGVMMSQSDRERGESGDNRCLMQPSKFHDAIPQSGFAPENFTPFAHFSVSSATSLPKSAPDSAITVAPS